MQQNEYLKVKEISSKYDMTARNVRRIISKIAENYSEVMLYKNKNNQWLIHSLLLPKFQPQRLRKSKYYALSIDPCYNYSDAEIVEIMEFVFSQMNDNKLEINYVIEQKKANSQNHIHCYVKCSNKKKLMQCIKLGFSKVSYHQSPIFDLNGWKNYITKDNNTIKILKND